MILRDGCPLPPVVHQWFTYRTEEARAWEEQLRPRFNAYVGSGTMTPSWEQTVDLDSLEFVCSDEDEDKDNDEGLD
mgnify:CR=1 FL=1